MSSILEILKSRLEYEPKTGLFKYRHDFNIMKKGDIAGRMNTNGHVQISKNGKRLHLGYFANIEEANKAYKEAANLHFGKFANVSK